MDRVLAAVVYIVTFKVFTSGRWFLAALVLMAFGLLAAGCDDYEQRQRQYYGDPAPLKQDARPFRPLPRDGRDG